VTASKPDSSFH
jgi:hypothetical protein